jgi:hypothetical protein
VPWPTGGRAGTARKAADHTVADRNSEGAALTDRYEQLRAAVLAGTGDGLRLGLGVLSAHGLAAWMNAWQAAPPPPTPSRPPSPVRVRGAGDVVRVLASMALAHV